MHELLNIVDEKDRVLGRATRSEIHRTQRLHRAVHMLVANSAGEIYLQKRAPSKDMNPNRWDSSAAGHVDAGEGYLQAAIREVTEELGVELSAGDFHEFFRLDPVPENGFEFQRYYAIITDQTLTPCPREISEARWFTPEAVDTWVASGDNALTPDLKTVWPVYRARKNT